MRKIIAGLGLAAVVAVGGYFGAQAYISHRIAGEIEANFAQIRANGGQASRGDLSFDLLHRSVAIADLAVSFASPQPATIKVGRFDATGIALGSASTFAAEMVVLSDIDAGGAVAPAGGLDVTIKAPRVEIADYSGPTQMPAQGKLTSPLDMYRAGLAQFAAISAREMKVPTLTVSAKGSALPGGAEYIYSDLQIRDIKDGRTATSHAGRVQIATTVAQAGKQVRMTGEMTDLTARDFDAAAVASVLDPAHADDANFYRIQGQVTTGAYAVTSDNGASFRIDSIRVGDTKVQPSKFKIQNLIAALPAATSSVDPARTRLLMETVASTYEGVQIDKAEMLGLSVQTPNGPVKLAAVRFNLDRGRIGEMAFEGLDGQSKEGPVKLGRFAIKGFDLSRLMRQTSQMIALKGTPAIEVVTGLLNTLEGIEFRDLVVPHKDTGKLISVHEAGLNWGQFTGPIPNNVRIKLNVTGPLEEKDGEPFTLLRDVGVNEATANIDVGLVWNETEKKLTLAPGTFDIDRLFALNVEMSADNVLRDLFTTNSLQAFAAAALVKPGRLKITLRDLGGIDLGLAKYAREHGATVDEARAAVLADVRMQSEALAETDPDAGKLGAAVAAFIEKPKGVLTISIAPRQSLRLLEIVDMLKQNGPDAISLFEVDAQAGP